MVENSAIIGRAKSASTCSFIGRCLTSGYERIAAKTCVRITGFAYPSSHAKVYIARKGSRRSAELRDAKNVATSEFEEATSCSQKVLAMVDFPVPASPASQYIQNADVSSLAHASISSRTSMRVSFRQPVGETRESYRAAETGFRDSRVSMCSH
jgi:hypothetical protein